MNNHKKNDEQMIPCEVCMKEVPVSEAAIEEADDYVRHFCGLECYAEWRAQNKAEDQN